MADRNSGRDSKSDGESNNAESKLRIGDVKSRSNNMPGSKIDHASSNAKKQFSRITQAAWSLARRNRPWQNILICIVIIVLMRGCYALIESPVSKLMHQRTEVADPLEQQLVMHVENMYLHYLDNSIEAEPGYASHAYQMANLANNWDIKTGTGYFSRVFGEAKFLGMKLLAIGEDRERAPSGQFQKPGLVLLLKGQPTKQLKEFQLENHCSLRDTSEMIPDIQEASKLDYFNGSLALSCRWQDFEANR